jgi:hypothetical protein
VGTYLGIKSKHLRSIQLEILEEISLASYRRDLKKMKGMPLIDGVAGIAQVQIGNLVNPTMVLDRGLAGKSDQGLFLAQRTRVHPLRRPS